jgi:glycosyltransferase involved in cell wall biosynthesis
MSDIVDLVCFSHLRWGFIFQRPNHLISRFARRLRTFFFEEPVFGSARPELEIETVTASLRIAIPHLPYGLAPEQAELEQQILLESMVASFSISRPAAWFYTPMALPVARMIHPCVTVYDCMDELSLFKGAPGAMIEREEELLSRADVVFTGGHSLFEHKRNRHANVHAFPSSVEFEHFGRARSGLVDPEDQASFKKPRVGYFGAIDERIDLELLARLADELAAWDIVMIGPVVKIEESSLPRRPNLHYLGLKKYEELPAYLAGWDVAMMPFARNDSTRFISPTKTLEYLAGGKPVVSTAIHDVVHPYGDLGVVAIADGRTFPAAVAAARAPWSRRQRDAVERVLATSSWDSVADRMWSLVERASRSRPSPELGAAACSTI